jgi:hypothetical protein
MVSGTHFYKVVFLFKWFNIIVTCITAVRYDKCHRVVSFLTVFGKLVRGSVNGIWNSTFIRFFFI